MRHKTMEEISSKVQKKKKHKTLFANDTDQS